ncbi:MAG: bifunctional glutathionylspermidine amidase/synthase [Pseudomonadales bacterium]|nr:bifunctional glutathionylspermidine amidase/synthase [Pseudomonadales bacterium]
MSKERFGALLGYAPGGVAAYSSDYETASNRDYPKRSAFRSYYDGIYMGYKWQCVEFARRWMYMNYGYIFDDVAMAYDIFELRSVRDVKSSSLLPLMAFSNGSKEHPVPGSLLIWKEGGEFEKTGHVAVVTEVFDDRIRIAEQNVSQQKWPEGQDYARELEARVGDDGEYWITCSYGDAEILGWMIQTDNDTHGEPSLTRNEKLFDIKSLHANTSGIARKAWLNIANHDEAAFVDMMGGHCLTTVEADQSRYFVLSKSARDLLEHATNELHNLFMHATDYVLANDDLLARFNLPAAVLPKIRRSWDNRLNELITSRFDFAMTRQGLKVYEYNCDSASCYMETGKVQGKWAKHYRVDDGDDAGAELFNALVHAWRKSHAKKLVHILRDDEPEEKYHAFFMQQALQAAGLKSKIITGLEGLVRDTSGDIVDAEGEQVRWVWKTWAWETALDQIRDESEVENRQGNICLSDVLLKDNIMVYEPLWSLIPSNKAILPVLWSLFPNHPLLLNTAFELTEELKASGYVIKPIVGRCGANISLLDSEDNFLESTGGNFDAQNTIYQALFPLPRVDGYYTQVSTYTAAGVYAGSGVRVDNSMIINKDSDCLALRFIDNKQFLEILPQRAAQ